MAAPPSAAAVQDRTFFLDHPDRAQLDQILAANSQEWRGPLSTAAYLRREALCADTDLTRNGGITFWALKATSPDNKAPDVVVAGCESVNKRALVSHGGQVHDVVCHGIASVFCLPAWRGLGLGKQMIAHLAEALPTWQQTSPEPRACFSVLYSDIGKDFYARRGWQPFASTHMLLPPLPKDQDQDQHHQSNPSAALPATTPITPSTLPALCKKDEALLRAKMSARPPNAPPAVAIIPDAQSMLWHFAREDFAAQELLHRVPETRGAIATIPGSDRKVWAVWAGKLSRAESEGAKVDAENHDTNTLYILRMVIEPRARSAAFEAHDLPGDEPERVALMAVLRAAQRHAREWHMDEVSVWNPCRRVEEAVRELAVPLAVPSDKSSDGSRFGQVHVRETDSICSLQWFGAGSVLSELEGATSATLDWVENERFAWC